MITVLKRLFVISESCGVPIKFEEAASMAEAVALATGQQRVKSLSAADANWFVAEISPNQREEIEALPPESVISFLQTLKNVSVYQ